MHGLPAAALAIVALAASAPACGEDVHLGAGRALPDATVEPDSAAPEPDAASAGPAFDTPVEIVELSSDSDAADDDPSLNTERTLLYFNSEREGGLGEEDIWVSQRASADDAWRAPEPASALNSELRETGIALAADGLAIWWSSDRDGGEGGLDVYGATRATPDSPWSAPQRIDELSSADDDLVSAVADGGRTVLLARRLEDGDYDLYLAQRSDPSQAFEEPQPIAELNSDDEESDAFLFADGTRLVFTYDENLVLAERASRTAPFGSAVPLDDLNSDADDRDAWTSEDLGYLVFSSDRGGSHRLYEARRSAR